MYYPYTSHKIHFLKWWLPLSLPLPLPLPLLLPLTHTHTHKDTSAKIPSITTSWNPFSLNRVALNREIHSRTLQYSPAIVPYSIHTCAAMGELSGTASFHPICHLSSTVHINTLDAHLHICTYYYVLCHLMQMRFQKKHFEIWISCILEV